MMNIKNKIHKCLAQLFLTTIEDNNMATFVLHLSLIDIITNASQRDLPQHYFEDLETLSYVRRARLYFHEWELYLESLMQRSFSQDNDLIKEENEFVMNVRNHYVEQYRHLVLNEIRLADVDKHTRVCHVGIGSMPLSLIMLHKYAQKCSIVGIDCIEEAIKAAELCVDSKALREPQYYNPALINLKYAEGAEFNYKDFDVVILSSSIMNKQKIVDRINLTINKNITLLDRSIDGLSHYIYEGSALMPPSNAKLIENFRLGLINLKCYQLEKEGL